MTSVNLTIAARYNKLPLEKNRVVALIISGRIKKQSPMQTITVPMTFMIVSIFMLFHCWPAYAMIFYSRSFRDVEVVEVSAVENNRLFKLFDD